MQHRTVPAAGQGTCTTAARRAQHDVEAVGLEPRVILREPGEIAVGEKNRLRVPGRIVGSEVDGRRAAVYRHLVEVEIRGPSFSVSGDARREHQRAAIAAEGEILVPTEGFT